MSAAVRQVVFRIGAERFALPLEAVREVVLPQPPFARVPRVSDAVRGVMNLRGRVVAVVDLAALVGLPPQPRDERAGQVLVLDPQGRRALGVLIGGVVGVEELAPPDDAPSGLVRGVVSGKAGAVTLLGAAEVTRQAEALFASR